MMNRAEWLEKRRNHIGASEVAAILGVDPFRGPLDVYHSKVNGHSQGDNDWMAFGRDVEGAIANLYASKTGRQVIDYGATDIRYHPDLPWLAATLDRVTVNDESESGPLELKHVGAYGVRVADWEAEPPIYNQTQLQVQIACMGATWGALAGMFPGYQLAKRDFEFNPEFFDSCVPILEAFWDRVQKKNPPPVDLKSNSLEIMKSLYKGDDRENIVAMSSDTMQLVEEWELQKSIKKGAEKEAKFLEAKLREQLKDATFGSLNDGRFLTLKTTQRKAYTRTVEASEFRTLRIAKKI